jgi:hypothetical protein
MSSATNLVSCRRSVELYRSGRLPLKFAREILWRPSFFSRTRSRTDANRFRWVHDRMDECWFAPYARCRVAAVVKVGARSRGTKPVIIT